MSTIKNTVAYETGVLTNPTSGTVLYDAGTTGETNGKGIANIYVTASAPISVTYTTIYGVIVTNQVWNMTSAIDLGSTAINHLELAANLTGTLELLANELMK